MLQLAQDGGFDVSLQIAVQQAQQIEDLAAQRGSLEQHPVQAILGDASAPSLVATHLKVELCHRCTSGCGGGSNFIVYAVRRPSSEKPREAQHVLQIHGNEATAALRLQLPRQRNDDLPAVLCTLAAQYFRTETLVDAVTQCKGAKRVTAAGSLRRGKETIGDIDILCEATKSNAPKIIETFASAPSVQRVLARGSTKGGVILTGEVQADLRVVESKSFGAALSYFTGSKDHNVRLRELAIQKGWKLNEYGLFEGERQLAGKDEQEIYSALDLAYVPPELREDRGEVEAAANGKLPKLITLKDIRGDLHVHTRASDGRNTIEEMIEASRARGYRYLGICDHSKSQIQANGLDEERLGKHVEAIRSAARKYTDIVVLAGCEVDVFKDGTLDFGADVLVELDFVTVSAHSALSQNRKDATKRLIKAIETPNVHCIGHPSGRLINKREGMEIDIEPIAAAAAANDVALELNAHYWRLDLRDVHVKAAISAGAKILINTDAHDIADLDMMTYGVTTARRGWATPEDVINTWTPAKLKKWLKRK